MSHGYQKNLGERLLERKWSRQCVVCDCFGYIECELETKGKKTHSTACNRCRVRERMVYPLLLMLAWTI